VVVLTNERDLAADDVIRRIDNRGFRPHRINAETVSESPVPVWELGAECGVGAVWWRQFELSAPRSPALPEAEDLLLVRTQWRAWLSVLDVAGVPWVNDLWSARRAEDKVTQLRTAKELGFHVPATIVTNHRDAAMHFAASKPCVVKTLASAYFELSGRGFVYTHSLDDRAFDNEDGWSRQPLIVQERVDGADVRVVVVGDRTFGGQCLAPTLDWRTAGKESVWEPWRVPSKLQERCVAYVRALSLRYAAFDFIDEGHRVWFLEANQAGEWSFLDRELDLGIADCVARFLIDLAAHQ
jgi:glutathione synthase/RimK-type ligase-like ATP-grasp enzyme